MTDRITPEMLEAGKIALHSHGAVLNAAVHSIPEAYLAMRAVDPEWVRMQEALRVERGIVGTLQWMISDQQRYRCAHGVQRFLVCGDCHVTQDKSADLQTPIPNADDFLISDGGIMAFSHWVGHELAPILRERGLWSGERDPLDKLRDMAALSHAAINAMHSWSARVNASGIEAGTEETPQAAQPEGREPGPQGDAQPLPSSDKERE